MGGCSSSWSSYGPSGRRRLTHAHAVARALLRRASGPPIPHRAWGLHPLRSLSHHPPPVPRRVSRGGAGDRLQFPYILSAGRKCTRGPFVGEPSRSCGFCRRRNAKRLLRPRSEAVLEGRGKTIGGPAVKTRERAPFFLVSIPTQQMSPWPWFVLPLLGPVPPTFDEAVFQSLAEGPASPRSAIRCPPPRTPLACLVETSIRREIPEPPPPIPSCTSSTHRPRGVNLLDESPSRMPFNQRCCLVHHRDPPFSSTRASRPSRAVEQPTCPFFLPVYLHQCPCYIGLQPHRAGERDNVRVSIPDSSPASHGLQHARPVAFGALPLYPSGYRSPRRSFAIPRAGNWKFRSNTAQSAVRANRIGRLIRPVQTLGTSLRSFFCFRAPRSCSNIFPVRCNISAAQLVEHLPVGALSVLPVRCFGHGTCEAAGYVAFDQRGPV